MKSIRVLLLLAVLATPRLNAGLPPLAIDSLPVAAACKPTLLTGTASGASLLRTASGARPTLPGETPSTASAGDLYQSTIDLADWGGHFSRYLLPAGGGTATTLAWEAGAILTGGGPSPAPTTAATPTPALRQIYTAIVHPDGTLTMTLFTWPMLSAAQQTLLDAEDHAGEQRVAYLRGDRSLEGAPFRRRSSILGDAVHSTPVHAGPPEHAAVYLGANDGMLHAFDANTGIELFAYIPDALLGQLHHLSNPAYEHRAYVDGPASAGEALIGSSSKTVLVAAMGGGAQGVFALDITDPTHFADGLGVLWEFTDRDDPLMGNVTTIPQIARLRVKPHKYRHFAIVPSGLNNYADDGHADSGKGALFLLALDKPRDEAWHLNSNYYRITTPIADTALANALNAPVLLNDSDGALHYAYAGDLQGNLWRFDFSGKAPWDSAPGKPLFVARDADGLRQPISQQPSLAYTEARGYMVLFGTGRLIDTADRSAASATQQSYYGIIDSLQVPLDTISGRSQLTRRFLDGSDLSLPSDSKGWYVDFTEPTERSLSSGVLANGALLFNTVLPGADMCSATRSRSYALNALTGRPDDGRFTAVLPSGESIIGLMLPYYAPQPWLLPQSVSHGVADPQGRMRQEKSYALVQSDGKGSLVTGGAMKTSKRVGRLSWREVANWRELHEAAK